MKENSPSSTANVVARNIAFVTATSPQFVSTDAARLNALFVERLNGSRFLKNLSRKWFQMFFRLYSFLTIRGLALHQTVRKLQIERIVRESLAKDFKQVVVLGGGFDTLALRLHKEFPTVNFIEFDHPATQNIKCEIIEKHQLGGEKLQFFTADFTKPHPFEIPNAKTIFICEGVTMYLETEEVKRLFDSIGKFNARFIFTFMERGKNGKTNFRNATPLVGLWLKWKKEPFKWGLAETELKDFLDERGFNLRELITAEISRQFYKIDAPIAEGENICVCDTVYFSS